MRLVKDGTIILDLEDVVETNHISCQTKGLSLIQFRSLEPFVLYEHGLPNPATQERSFLVNVFDKLTSCSEVEEEVDEGDGRHENFLGEVDMTVAALEAMPMHLNLGLSNRSDQVRFVFRLKLNGLKIP